MKIELSREQYIELLQAVFTARELRKAYYQQNGQGYIDESTLGEYLLNLAPSFDLEKVGPQDADAWTQVLEEQGQDMMESYVIKMFWEKLAWDLALEMYTRKHGSDQNFEEEKFLAVTEISNQLLIEFEKNRLQNVAVNGVNGI